MSETLGALLESARLRQRRHASSTPPRASVASRLRRALRARARAPRAALVARGLAPGERVAIVRRHRSRASSTRSSAPRSRARSRCRSTRPCASAASTSTTRAPPRCCARRACALVLADRAHAPRARRDRRARAAGARRASCRASSEPRRTAARDLAPDAIALRSSSPRARRSEPKPVALTHRQVLANVRAIRDAILAAYPESGARTHSAVSWLPLYHDMGLVGGVFARSTTAGDLVLIPPELFIARPALWLRAISRQRATISPAPNFAYALCAERMRDEELSGVDLSSWRVALNGAEPVTPRVLERFVERFARVRPATRGADARLRPRRGDARGHLQRAPRALPPSTASTRRARERDELARGSGRRGGSRSSRSGVRCRASRCEIRRRGGAPLAEGRLGRVLVRGPVPDARLRRPARRRPRAACATAGSTRATSASSTRGELLPLRAREGPDHPARPQPRAAGHRAGARATCAGVRAGCRRQSARLADDGAGRGARGCSSSARAAPSGATRSTERECAAARARAHGL